MKVKVEFEAIVAKKDKHRYLVELPGSEHVIGVEGWIPAHLCTPVLPDFEDGDLVEHVPSGARGRVTPYDSGRLIMETVGERKELRIEVPTCRRYDGVGNGTNWLAADCRIVRKAGEGRRG